MNATMEKKNYVESLNEFLKPMQDFNDIKYAKSATGEYIRVTDIIGGCAFIDVTGEGCDGILDAVATLVKHGVPKGVIHDTPKKRQIAPLFR